LWKSQSGAYGQHGVVRVEGVSCLYRQNLSKSKRNVPESAKMFRNLQKAQINCIQSMEFEKN
jgi:hypothetical protein